MADVTLYGIPNCETVKKARVWLDQHGIVYSFHDYKKAGVDEAGLRASVDELGWEMLLNRSGTTFRKLPDEDKRDLDADRAMALMVANPSAIKRPVVSAPGVLLVGFSADRYAATFGAGG